MVQVVAARRLFEHGIMVKDGSAMERLVEIDTIVFDKTGTLTMGLPGLRRDVPVDEAHLAIAARIGAHSHHPYAQALAAAATSASLAFDPITEPAGLGLEARLAEAVGRPGRGQWALGDQPAPGRGGHGLACTGRLA